MASDTSAPPPKLLRSDRQAMLIIHGIGEQNPYETLDSFARGVFTYFKRCPPIGKKPALYPISIAHKDWTQVGMRVAFYPEDQKPPECIPPGSPDEDGAAELASEIPPQYVDLYEYYWAPDTEGELSAIETLKWVLKTDFEPLRYFADDLQLQLRLPGITKSNAVFNSLKTFARELRRVLLYYIPLMVAAGYFLGWLSKDRSWSTAFKTLVPELMKFASPRNAAVLFFYAVGLLMVWFLLQGFAEFRQHPGDAIDAISDRIWLILDLVCAAVFFAAARLLDLHFGQHALYRAVTAFGDGRWKPLAAAAVAAICSYALTAYAADVAVYTDMDAKSKNYVTRNAILANSTAMLRVLLTCNDYDRVVLAGHSLGSVIAYDSINELLDQRNAWPGPPWDTPTPFLTLAQLQRLKGLVTFGSPLDKVFYFFREHVKRDQAIRAQILAMMHSFRRRGAGRDYGIFRFNYSFRQLDSGPDPIVWLNAWARMDPVSSDLKFYSPDDQRQFHYPVPVAAHLSYWSDPEFFEYSCGKLL